MKMIKNFLKEKLLISILLLPLLLGQAFNTQAQTQSQYDSKTKPYVHTGSCKSFLYKMRYYFSKFPEVGLMFDSQALRMIKVGKAASKNKKHTRMEKVALDDIRLYHPVDTSGAMAKTESRKEVLRKHQDILLKNGYITAADIDKYISSIDPIQLIAYEDPSNNNNQKKSYLAIQGQGRIVSMKGVFKGSTPIEVEVSEVDAKILVKLLKVRSEFIKDGRLKNDQ